MNEAVSSVLCEERQTEELPFSQQEVQLSLCGPLAVHPSLPPNAIAGQPPPTNTQGMVPSAIVAGRAILLMDPSDLAALQQATCHLVLLPGDHNPAVLAPLTDPTVCEEQTPLQSRRMAQAPSSHTYHANNSELPFGQHEVQSASFGPLTVGLSPPPILSTSQPPAADPEQGWTALGIEVAPIEEVCRDHSSAELVGGWGW